MELDALKNSWNTMPSEVNQDEFDIISATKKEMTSPLEKLRQTAKRQTKILPILFAVLVVIAAKIPNAKESFLIWMALVIVPLTTLYYYFNLKLIGELEGYNGSVKNNIQVKLKKLIRSNRIYLILTRVVFALLMIVAEILIRDNQSHFIAGLEVMASLTFPVRILIYAAIIGLHYAISRYTFEYYFGKYTRQLKNILSQMQ